LEARLTMAAAESSVPSSAVRPLSEQRAALRVRLIGKSNGVGLSRDFDLLEGALRAAGCEVSAQRCERRERRRRRAVSTWMAAKARRLPFIARRTSSSVRWDLNVMLEHVWPQFLHQARHNVLVPNPEWCDRRDRSFFDAIDRLWTKSAMAEQLFRALGCATFHIGFDSEERLCAEVGREAKFLHLAGRSPLKGTQRLLSLWRRHPEWPTLTVIENDAMPDKSAAIRDSHNILYRRGYMSDETLRQLQNAHRFHVCPSEAEGWGHYIAEAMSVRAITITTDAPPMNELVRPERGVLVAGQGGAQHNLARLVCFDEAALEQAIARCLSLRTEELEALGSAARAWFLANKGGFAARIAAAIDEIAPLARAA
jgi:glycosyltransferase involved in cell wall biosynthesis